MGSNASRIGQASTLYFHKAHESFYVEMHIATKKARCTSNIHGAGVIVNFLVHRR